MQLISGAIEITKFLNERYLWVDALCIIQDDQASKTKQIVQMDKIFLSAALTIVCARGEDVHTGLKPHGTHRVDPGLTICSRGAISAQRIEKHKMILQRLDIPRVYALKTAAHIC